MALRCSDRHGSGLRGKSTRLCQCGPSVWCGECGPRLGHVTRSTGSTASSRPGGPILVSRCSGYALNALAGRDHQTLSCEVLVVAAWYHPAQKKMLHSGPAHEGGSQRAGDLGVRSAAHVLLPRLRRDRGREKPAHIPLRNRAFAAWQSGAHQGGHRQGGYSKSSSSQGGRDGGPRSGPTCLASNRALQMDGR